jgi:SAM-dependent methyltransferase
VFDVAAEAYDSYMGRYSRPLAPLFADFAGVGAGRERVLDVGCGPGALTSELVARLGPSAVHAVDPSESFVSAARDRHPGVEVERASAEQLPFPNAEFDASLAQLVVHFMADASKGLAEMARVTRPGGVVAACVWDHGGGQGPLSGFWDVAGRLDPGVEDESELAGARRGHLAELLAEVGLREIDETTLSVSVDYASFDEWWEPLTRGVGPAGTYLSTLDGEHRTRIRELCRARSDGAGFTVTASAWAARGRA